MVESHVPISASGTAAARRVVMSRRRLRGAYPSRSETGVVPGVPPGTKASANSGLIL